MADTMDMFLNNSYNCSIIDNLSDCFYVNSEENKTEFVDFPTLIVIFSKIFYGLVCVMGLCGNTLVIYVVFRFSKMQTVTNMYILNLALADEMFLIGLPFLLTTMTYDSWPFGSVMCKIYMTTTSINQFTSSLLLTVMSADRYIAVCHPISSPRYRTPFIAKFICLTAWTVSALLMVPIYMYATTMEADRYVSCTIHWPDVAYMTGEKAFTLYAFTLGFAIPLVLILLFYFLVICKLKTVGPKKKSKEKKRSHRKVTYLVLTVITVYVLCWFPYWVTQVWLTFAPSESQSTFSITMILFAGVLSYTNSAVNPILYAFLSDNFKKSFAKAFTCAARTEVNAQLHGENSVFPRSTKGGSGRPQKRNNPNITRDFGRDVDASTAMTTMTTKQDKQDVVVRNGMNNKQDVEETTVV